MRSILLWSKLYRQRDWNSERVRNLPKDLMLKCGGFNLLMEIRFGIAYRFQSLFEFPSSWQCEWVFYKSGNGEVACRPLNLQWKTSIKDP